MEALPGALGMGRSLLLPSQGPLPHLPLFIWNFFFSPFGQTVIFQACGNKRSSSQDIKIAWTLAWVSPMSRDIEGPLAVGNLAGLGPESCCFKELLLLGNHLILSPDFMPGLL